MCDETPEERQTNEMVALQAIYGDAVVDNRRKAAWNEFRPLDLSITLYPLHNSDGNHCSATVQFKCCHNYPDKPPVILLKKIHGISNDNATKMLGELEKMAVDLCGEVMIFQLAQHIQQFLHDRNKPTLSFYDEMLKQKTEMEELKKHDMQVKENEERQKMKDEIQRRQETLKGGGRRVRLSSLQQEVDPDDGHGDAPKLLYYADDKLSPARKVLRSRNTSVPCTCGSKGTQVFRYTQRNNKKVYVGNCIGHSVNGSTSYLAIDDDGQRVVAKKWSLPPATDFQTRNRQLTALQQDLRATCRLKHPHLAPYVAMEVSTESKRTGRQLIYVFRDFVLGVSLKSLQDKCGVFDKSEGMSLLREVGVGVFGALSALHGAGVAHRDVRAETVFLQDAGPVRLVGGALDSRICEIVEGDSYCDRQTQSHDIYSAAQLLLSLVSESSQETPPHLPSAAKDFFSRCLTEDEHCQWSAEQLTGHGFLTDAPSNTPSSRTKENGESESEDEDGTKRIQWISTLANGHSRLNMEFEVLAWLGKGAFGDVLKVRNKLDGGLYAIKHVKLNPRSVELNRKVTREVKLLSRLNHENVVRYYNAWIETVTATAAEGASDEEATDDTPQRKQVDSLVDVGAKLGEVKVNWSMSDGPVQIRDESSESEEDSDDGPDSWFNMIKPDDDSSSNIEFAVDSNKSQSVPSEGTPECPRVQLKQMLYIQMEFCEKNTLRQAIDNGLHQETFRAWRLFREILEGLAHVHQKGMIHRDLKPVNIFLDSNDHVKIGDFGLATKVFTGLPAEDKIKSQDDHEGLLTGKVGTALYVAPELQQSTSTVIYNQKVDIYSLGIILFEMFHAPFNTAAERYTVLTNLRDRNIVMPEDFVRGDNAKQIHVIRWLLEHEASARPTSAELLASERVPRAVPEGALASLLAHTLAERARPYRRLVAACLDQRPSPAEDFTFHQGVRTKHADAVADIKERVVNVLKRHGATEWSPPLLTPRAARWDGAGAVRLMTPAGAVCHLPHDLRLPFARYTAYSGTRYMRRYAVERVFRDSERTANGFHPREMIECAFDIVSPNTESLWADAEVLAVASRAAAACGLRVAARLNHAELLRGALRACGVPPDKHRALHPVLVDFSCGRLSSVQLATHLATLCVSARDLGALARLLEARVAVAEARALAAPLAAPPAALDHITAVHDHARALGCECEITVAPFMAYNAAQHNGVFWQLSAARPERPERPAKHRARDLIAAGGRYDTLVEEFWKVARAEKDQNAELKCSSVGFSMSLERMAAILKSMDVDLPSTVKESECSLISVCVRGERARAGAALARALWAEGRRCVLWAGGDARELAGAHIELVPDHAYVLVRSWENNRFREHKVPFTDVVEFVKQKLSPEIVRTPEFGSRSTSWSECERGGGPSVAVTFITASHRITKNTKRHCELQIVARVTSQLSALGAARARVCVLALAAGGPCVRALAAQLDAPLDARALPQAFREVADTFYKQQSILDEAQRELAAMLRQGPPGAGPQGPQGPQGAPPGETQLYALYSIPDSLCRLIT